MSQQAPPPPAYGAAYPPQNVSPPVGFEHTTPGGQQPYPPAEPGMGQSPYPPNVMGQPPYPPGMMGPQPGDMPSYQAGLPMGGIKAAAQAMGPGYDGSPMLQNHDPTSDGEDPDTQFDAFSEKAIRHGFIKKVFGILALQLLITAGVVCMFLFWQDLKLYSLRNQWMYIVAMCVTFGMIIVLGCVNDLRRKFPINFICLLIFTLAMSWMLGSVAARFSAKEVLMAVGIVFAVTVVMMLLGIQQKFDFTWLLGICSILTVVLLCFGFLLIFFHNTWLYTLYAALGALLFSAWLLIDIQMLMGGKHRYAIDPEEYIFAALNIYIDIINLLMSVLMLIKAAAD